MVRKILFLVLISLLFTCTSKQDVQDAVTQATVIEEEAEKVPEKRSGFRYDIPEDMEVTHVQFMDQYDKVLIEKGSDPYNSPKVIAIRHTNSFNEYATIKFVEIDQSMLKQQVKSVFYESGWTPVSLKEKNIDHIPIQFSYEYGKMKIYQRSIYIKFMDTFYIVSLSAKEKNKLYDENSEKFWESIYAD